ncbi:MAG: hypothetical protein R3C71_09835 [Candidatus Krumholzibacteriia bacterium]|nr:hypothetical protein [bacterium]
MSALAKISTLDRRWIFLMIGLSVALPLMFPFSQPVKISPSVEQVYDALSKLEDGSRVLVSFEYGPSTLPEIHPMSYSVLNYLFDHGHKVIITCLWPDGLFMSQDILERITRERPNLKYGVDYVNLGYKPGNEVVIKAITGSFSATFPVDTMGQPLSSYPIMEGMENLANIDFIFSLSAGYPGTVEWVQYAADPLRKPMSTGCTAVQVTEVVPYVQSGQCKGILGGLSGAAEFEQLLVHKGDAKEIGQANSGMAAQGIAHLVIVAFIIIGNLAFYAERRRQRKY